jgi:hypothetical protein
MNKNYMWVARFYLTNRKDSVPISYAIDHRPEWNEEWTKNGPFGWKKAELYRRYRDTGGLQLMDEVYS